VLVEKRIVGRVFGEVAEDYDRVRLAYPVALIDDVLNYSQVAADRRRALARIFAEPFETPVGGLMFRCT
jgi:hypothetical protein